MRPTYVLLLAAFAVAVLSSGAAAGRCTVAADCSGHAVAVSGNSTRGCVCTCMNFWSGAQCQTCPAKYNAAENCGSCAPGFSGYPNCVRRCTVAVDCNGHAVAVSGTPATGCSCTCRNAWSGAACGTCAAKYNAAEDCGACAVGGNYPNCVAPAPGRCTIAVDCSGHAVAVSGNSTGGCVCTCMNAWSGAQCQVCPTKYNPAENCGSFAPGFSGYPN
jgi:hypothetical protein